MFVVKSRSTGVVVCQLSDVEEALVADSRGDWRVDAAGYESVLELARARCEASPDYNLLPSQEDKYVIYTSRAGRQIMCEVVRLTHPDAEGYPQLLEVVNLQRPDGSFMVQANAVKPVDLNKMSPALANALLQGDQYEQNGGGNMPKLTRGLRKKPE